VRVLGLVPVASTRGASAIASTTCCPSAADLASALAAASDASSTFSPSLLSFFRNLRQRLRQAKIYSSRDKTR
jgi:hypothetical protein